MSTTVSNSPTSSNPDIPVATVVVGGSVYQQMVSGLINTPYDQMVLSYTSGNLTGVVYKLLGVTVATLTLAYSGTTLTSVVRT